MFVGVVIDHVLYWFRRGGVAYVAKGPVEGDLVVGLTGSDRFAFTGFSPEDSRRLLQLLVMPRDTGGGWGDGGGPREMPPGEPVVLSTGRLRAEPVAAADGGGR